MKGFYMFLPSLLALLLLSAETMQAQSKRMVLIEEATNASCPPCAAQNPFFEHYLNLPHNQDRIIPVIWHSRFPGRDVMNAANATMHNARVTYNAVSGVPGTRVNGQTPPSSGGGYAGAPSDTIALSNAVAAVPETSPMEITIEQFMTGNKMRADVRIASTEEMGSRKLYAVVVEGYHYYDNAGSNGEKEFPNIARTMLPSHEGSQINILPGTTTLSFEDIAIDPEWNRDELYIVAWVQDDGTKEVLQAGTSRGLITANGAKIETAKIATPERKESWSYGITPSANGTYTVSLHEDLPEGWSASVSIADNMINQSGQEIVLASSDISTINVEMLPVSSSDKKGVGKVELVISGPQGTRYEQTFRLYSPDLQAIVLTRDGGVEEIASAYDRALREGDHVYAIVDQEDEEMFDWQNYVVVMEVGKWALEVADIANLKTNLNNGNARLYLIGAEIGYGLADPQNTSQQTPRDVAFMEDDLHATYVKDANSSTSVSGIPGDPIGDGMNFSFKNGVQNQDTPDEIAPGEGALPSFYYGSNQNQIAGIRYADQSNRLVYLGFGAEGIGDEAARTALLNKGITWLLGSEQTTGVEESAEVTGLSVEAGPNPATDQLEVHYRLGSFEEITIELLDLKGNSAIPSLKREQEAGSYHTTIDLSDVSSGFYLVTITTATKRVTQPVMVVR